MTFSKTVRIGKKGQMVLPKPIRDFLTIREGDEILIALQEEGQVILTTPARYAEHTRGLLKGTWGKTANEVKDYLEGERESWQHTETGA